MPLRAQAAATALVAALGLAGCGSEPEPAAPPERGPEFFAAALASVEKTPEPLREELLKTCDKYRHRDRPCDPERVRRDLLECWTDKGEAALAWTSKSGMGSRRQYTLTLLDVNICMEYKGWRKIHRGPDLGPHRG